MGTTLNLAAISDEIIALTLVVNGNGWFSDCTGHIVFFASNRVSHAGSLCYHVAVLALDELQ
jgi:hypothetical protein